VHHKWADQLNSHKREDDLCLDMRALRPLTTNAHKHTGPSTQESRSGGELRCVA
jgi:hypothetical protein